MPDNISIASCRLLDAFAYSAIVLCTRRSTTAVSNGLVK